MDQEKTLHDYKTAGKEKTSPKEFLRKLISLSGYSLVKNNVQKNPQQLKSIVAKHFFDLYFSMIDTENFFFIQLGANDGKSRDRMHSYISKYNLRGLLVEPQEDVFAKLKDNYSNLEKLQFANVAIANRDGTQTLYKVKESLINERNYFETTAISSLDKAITKRSIKKRIPHVIENISNNLDDYIEETTTNTLTFNSLLKMYNVPNADFLFTDCDGYDGKIIKSIDFNVFTPKVINYESCVLSDTERTECESILESHGYQLFRHGNDTCAFKV